MKSQLLFGVFIIFTFFSCEDKIEFVEEQNIPQTKIYTECCCAPTSLTLSESGGCLKASWSCTHELGNCSGYLACNGAKEGHSVFFGGAMYESSSFAHGSVTSTNKMVDGKSYNVVVTCTHNQTISAYYHYIDGGNQSLHPCPHKYAQMHGEYIYNHDPKGNMSRIVVNIRFTNRDTHNEPFDPDYRFFVVKSRLDKDGYVIGDLCYVHDGMLPYSSSGSSIEIPIVISEEKTNIRIKMMHPSSACVADGSVIHYAVIDCLIDGDYGWKSFASYEKSDGFYISRKASDLD